MWGVDYGCIKVENYLNDPERLEKDMHDVYVKHQKSVKKDKKRKIGDML